MYGMYNYSYSQKPQKQRPQQNYVKEQGVEENASKKKSDWKTINGNLDR